MTRLFCCQQDKTGRKLNIRDKTAMRLVAKRSPSPRTKQDKCFRGIFNYKVILMPEANQKVCGGDAMLCKPILVFSTNFPNNFLIPHIHVEDLRIIK